jgi:hypothetical protein
LNEKILHIEVQDFINSHLNAELNRVALQKNPFPNIDFKEILNQIETKKKAEKKLPTWFHTPNIYFPKKINLEQTSSEITAAYKADLLNGTSVADLTGGFGIDTYFFSKKVAEVDHYEINQELSEIASYNFKQLGVKNIKCFPEDGIKAIQHKKYNTIYIDPSRRSESKGKVFLLEDCIPNVVENKNYLLSRCEKLIIKTSPMLDINAARKSLEGGVNEIHIVAVNNEVKELLWVLENNNNPTKIVAINIENYKTSRFDVDKTTVANIQYSLPKNFLYEPNAAILKSGAFDEVAERFKIYKLHMHSHLYTSDEKIDFPGRVFEIEKTIAYKKKDVKENLSITAANITTRNFPETVEALRKKWKWKEGGDNYLFFTTNMDGNKIIVQCKKN